MTDLETMQRVCGDCGLSLGPDSALDRATQALKDAAMAYATLKADPNPLRAVENGLSGARIRLTRAAEDYADAYLRAK